MQQQIQNVDDSNAHQFREQEAAYAIAQRQNVQNTGSGNMPNEIQKFRRPSGAVQMLDDQCCRNQGEEEILSWSGPPKTPISPIRIDKPLFVTETEYRLPRRILSGVSKPMSTKMKSPIASTGVQKKKNPTNKHSPKKAGQARAEQAQRPSDTHCQDNGNSYNRAASSNMPPRDPLLHRPVVTPPCPIMNMPTRTPNPQRAYTHVSLFDATSPPISSHFI